MLEAWRHRRLVERAQARDPEAFSELLTPELEALHRAAYFLARDADDARDLAQEACVRAFVAIDQFRPGAPLRPWLHRILRNAFVDRVRSAAARHEVTASSLGAELEVDAASAPAAGDQPAEASALEALLARERRDELGEHVRALPAAFREVLVRCDVQGLAYAEVAEITGLPLGTVKSRLARARLALRERLLAAGEPSGRSSRIQRRGGA